MDWIRLAIGPDEGATTLQLCIRLIPLLGFGILCVRVAGRRTFAQYSPLDIIVALIVGSNISRIMMGRSPVVSGLIVTFALVLLHRLLAIASMRWGFLASLVKSPPIRVITAGKVDADALRRANLSEADLYEAIRMEQVAEPADVELAVLEASGKLSVVPMKRQ